MRNILMVLVSLLIATSQFPIYAGGPLEVKNGKAVSYGSRPFVYRYDKGPLGMFSNEEAVNLFEGLLNQWETVPTARITIQKDDPAFLDFDVTSSNYRSIIGSPTLLGYSPIVFDHTGSLFDAVFGFGASSHFLGFAGSTVPTTGPLANQIAESHAVFNGKFVNGVDNSLDRESSVDSFKGTVLHELGHALGLDHSQINVEAIKSFNAPQEIKDLVPLMFPIGVNDLFVIRRDDASAISFLYPNEPELTKFGKIEGKVFRDNGLPVLGANVIARNIDNPRLEAISCVSDYLADKTGSFTLFAIPAGKYWIVLEPIDVQFTGGSGVGPYSDGLFSGSFRDPVPTGLYTGPNLPITNYKSRAQIIEVKAGEIVSNINIIAKLDTNILPPPDDLFCQTCTNDYQCALGQSCIMGCCQKKSETCLLACSTDDDCFSSIGETCINGCCDFSAATPSSTTSSSSGSFVCQSCNTSNECSGEEFCDFSSNCCKYFGCLLNCKKDTDCYGFPCKSNCCIFTPSGTSSSSSSSSSSGVTIPNCKSCLTSSECNSSEICDYKYKCCTPFTCTRCINNDDCFGSFQCISNCCKFGTLSPSSSSSSSGAIIPNCNSCFTSSDCSTSEYCSYKYSCCTPFSCIRCISDNECLKSLGERCISNCCKFTTSSSSSSSSGGIIIPNCKSCSTSSECGFSELCDYKYKCCTPFSCFRCISDSECFLGCESNCCKLTTTSSTSSSSSGGTLTGLLSQVNDDKPFTTVPQEALVIVHNLPSDVFDLIVSVTVDTSIVSLGTPKISTLREDIQVIGGSGVGVISKRSPLPSVFGIALPLIGVMSGESGFSIDNVVRVGGAPIVGAKTGTKLSSIKVTSVSKTPPASPDIRCDKCSGSSYCSVGNYCDLSTGCCSINPGGCIFGCTNDTQCNNGQLCVSNCCTGSPTPIATPTPKTEPSISLTGQDNLFLVPKIKNFFVNLKVEASDFDSSSTCSTFSLISNLGIKIYPYKFLLAPEKNVETIKIKIPRQRIKKLLGKRQSENIFISVTCDNGAKATKNLVVRKSGFVR